MEPKGRFSGLFFHYGIGGVFWDFSFRKIVEGEGNDANRVLTMGVGREDVVGLTLCLFLLAISWSVGLRIVYHGKYVFTNVTSKLN